MKKKTAAEKVKIFRNLFSGVLDAYGTYNPVSKKSWLVKAPVTDRVILDHLTGLHPYGVYLLIKDRIRAMALDFDSENRLRVVEFVEAAKRYGISAYVERSKSKGYHAWIFFEEKGVLARKARLVASHLLNEIEKPAGEPEIEIFPKQDALDPNTQYGNFINTPLFGPLVTQGKTVFIELMSFSPYPDQWDVLESVQRVRESDLDNIININNLSAEPTYKNLGQPTQKVNSRHGLPICIQKIFTGGVSQNQRNSCFWLAVHLKRLGFPFDMAVAALKTWALKNKPTDGKGIIREEEIVSQTSCAYKKTYAGYGCNEAALKPFCEPSCPVKQWKDRNVTFASGNNKNTLRR